MNYHQFLVLKRISKQISISADYTFHDGAETLRQALKISWENNRCLDALLFENYQRLDVNPAWGYSLILQKNPFKNLKLSGGFANIDQYYGIWN
jgi:hypothetical protein